MSVLHRPAVAALLSAVADAEQSENTGQIVVKEIRGEKNGDLRLSGLCRRTDAADAFATKFEYRLSDLGWRVGAAQKQLRADGLAFDFAIVLTPVVLLDYPFAGTPSLSTQPGTQLGTQLGTQPATQPAVVGTSPDVATARAASGAGRP